MDNMRDEQKDISRDMIGPVDRPGYGPPWDEIPSLKNENAITDFLGEGPRAVEAFSTRWYYYQLLAWSAKHALASNGWETISALGFRSPKALFSDISTGSQTRESCLTDGQILLKKNDCRMVITLDGACLVQAEAAKENQGLVEETFNDFMNAHNLYQGKKIKFGHTIAFLDVADRDWDSVVLDADTKKGIYLNTIGFLNNIVRLGEFGVPAKRGIILSGKPGTGKTIVCKALMSEAHDITCIVTDAYQMWDEDYLSNVYAIANDLSPAIIFIKDIDSIARERDNAYRGFPPLIALLAEMDGIIENKAIVTVATSNSFETLDKALSERPSRFDRVFTLSVPDYQRRVEILKNLGEKIPLSEDNIEYIAKKTEGFTPAQLQEVPYSMVNLQLNTGAYILEFKKEDIDTVIDQINHKKSVTMGFKPASN